MNFEVLLTALGGASVPSVLLEVARTLRARSREMRDGEADQRRAPLVDAAFVVTAARDATTVQQAVLAQLLAQLSAVQAENVRLHAENDRLRMGGPPHVEEARAVHPDDTPV
ncbi:hypothetical protein [Streptomyces sp. CBMA29]|uniref:hypothetical protein n=1 Tax=Streptomyces sp. CBMA29 TaxID=1896314 RepID=UPI001661C83C|nr:hypothetical protein [Streptomyces sp. CBMA29]MBD0734022.1 hypothetical protein [Streptomyces sp. CBMA29]